jgi:hypothetical protein
MYYRSYVENILVFITVCFIEVYGLVYSVLPMFLVDLYNTPLGIFICYMSVYLTALWSKILGLVMMILVVSIHIQLIPFLFSREILSRSNNVTSAI